MIGKYVDVFFGRADALFRVKVRDFPHDVGDSWVLESANGQVHQVIFFERMSECAPESKESTEKADNSASPKPCDTCLHQGTYTCTHCSYFHVSLYKASGE